MCFQRSESGNALYVSAFRRRAPSADGAPVATTPYQGVDNAIDDSGVQNGWHGIALVPAL